MGAIKKVSCNKCKSSWEVMTGSGMCHSSLKAVSESYSEEVARQILECEKENERIVFDFGFHPAICRECKRVTSVPVLKIKNTCEEYIGGCDRCNVAVELADAPEMCKCPVCGEDVLSVRTVGDWD